MDPLTLVIILILMFIGIPLFIFLRMKSMYKIEIVRDVRNPSREPLKRWASFSKRDMVVKFYKSPIHPMAEKTQSYFDPNAFAFKKRILCYIGVSGKSDDDNIVPISMPLVSGATANQFAQKVSDHVLDALAKTSSKTGVQVDQQLYDTLKEVFTKEWAMHVFGITEIKDVNLILQHQKIQVADLHSRTNEFKLKHQSWLTKNGPMILTAVMFVIICIGAVILWQGTYQIIANNNANAQVVIGLLQKNLNKTAPVTTVPAPTTILPGHGNVNVT